MAGEPGPVVPRGIPKITFDYFNLGEMPTFILCNPNKEELYSLGGISERKLSAKFNTVSEISFRADEYVDDVYMPYYEYLKNKRLINIISSNESVGYFLINKVDEINDGINKYKEIAAQSLEVELSSKRLVVYVSGSGVYDKDGNLVSNDATPVTLPSLLSDLTDNYIPGWTFGYTVSPEISTKRRGFDISDKTVYDFLIDDVSESFGVLFDFDTIDMIINVYDPDSWVKRTNIYISHDNVVKSLTMSEVTDELSTCLHVIGGEGIDIRAINPLGNNYIYDFSYFTTYNSPTGPIWMDEDLYMAILNWKVKVMSYEDSYIFFGKGLYDLTDRYEEYDGYCEITSGSLAVLNTELNALEAQDPQNPTLIAQKQAEIAIQKGILLDYISTRDAAQAMIDVYTTKMQNIANLVALDNIDNFSEEQYTKLQPFIIQTSYVNNNIIATTQTTASGRFELMQQLYDDALVILDRVSEPKYTFEVDSVNFLQIKDFQKFRDEISLGAQVTCEVTPGKIFYPVILGLEMNFDDPTDFKLSFGTRLRLDSEGFKLSDLLKKSIDAGNSTKVNLQQWNQWVRNYKSNVTTTIKPIDSKFNVGSTSSIGVFDGGYKEGVYINTGSYVNIITPNLLWNGYPIGTGGTIVYQGAGEGITLGEGPGIDIANNKVGLGGDTILLYRNNHSTPVSEYTDLTAALNMATYGTLVLLPPGSYSGDFLIPEGVIVSSIGNNSTILGSVTLNNGSAMKGISITLTKSSVNSIYALIGNYSGSATLNDCGINVSNTNSGNAFSVLMSNGNLTLWNCYINSTSKYTGNAVCVYESSTNKGRLYSNDCYYTAQSTGTGKGHAFSNIGLGDWYITGGKIIATTSPVGEI